MSQHVRDEQADQEDHQANRSDGTVEENAADAEARSKIVSASTSGKDTRTATVTAGRRLRTVKLGQGCVTGFKDMSALTGSRLSRQL